MTPNAERIHFLIRVAVKERRLLNETTGRLFLENQPVTEVQVRQWIADTEKAERLDAFVARFGRLQDTLGDKLIPALLSLSGENIGPAMDNLDKAERFGWIESAEDWQTYRKLRNQMVHEYIEDPRVLADALEAGRSFVEPLARMAEILVAEAQSRSHS